VIPIGKEEKAI